MLQVKLHHLSLQPFALKTLWVALLSRMWSLKTLSIPAVYHYCYRCTIFVSFLCIRPHSKRTKISLPWESASLAHLSRSAVATWKDWMFRSGVKQYCPDRQPYVSFISFLTEPYCVLWAQSYAINSDDVFSKHGQVVSLIFLMFRKPLSLCRGEIFVPAVSHIRQDADSYFNHILEHFRSSGGTNSKDLHRNCVEQTEAFLALLHIIAQASHIKFVANWSKTCFSVRTFLHGYCF